MEVVASAVWKEKTVSTKQKLSAPSENFRSISGIMVGLNTLGKSGSYSGLGTKVGTCEQGIRHA